MEAARTDKKRKAVALTVDNADDVFNESFDLDAFIKFLDQTSNTPHNRDLIYGFMKASILDPKVIIMPGFIPFTIVMFYGQVVPFTSASKRHLNLLGINLAGELELDPDRVEAFDFPDSAPNMILRQDVVNGFKKHFSLSKESGCRCVIDQFLLAAATYAQQIINTDDRIKASLTARYFIRKPHVAVFTELQIPKTTVSHNGVSYIFHGFLDYGIGLIRSGDQDALEDGRYKIEISEARSSVVEAKNLDEMQGAHAQVIMQVLTALVLTTDNSSGRTTFTGALSNGAMWRFYTAEKKEDFGYQVYSSSLYAANKRGGLIVELLKDMVTELLHPLYWLT
ncbi:hypothetical protein M378DRAFT_181226 [Amanita muscaria Koide BX008]|uniref:Uncharacterized protein n=1 Tax=Amanita muscaria (strain Koide BX008) TaxID=946122 RepID=A0A0C2SWU0_AMAMK|nr:hypothetical protein M378DRAFT_181226 [Amanita muscaria Koide BX008]